MNTLGGSYRDPGQVAFDQREVPGRNFREPGTHLWVAASASAAPAGVVVNRDYQRGEDQGLAGASLHGRLRMVQSPRSEVPLPPGMGLTPHGRLR